VSLQIVDLGRLMTSRDESAHRGQKASGARPEQTFLDEPDRPDSRRGDLLVGL